MNVETRREVDLFKEVLELRDPLPIELDVMEVLARANLLLVPTAVAEDQAVQHAEPVSLGVALRLYGCGRNELARGE